MSERVTEYKLAGKYRREKFWKSKFFYKCLLKKIMIKLLKSGGISIEVLFFTFLHS